jgi:hypothetical protein
MIRGYWFSFVGYFLMYYEHSTSMPVLCIFRIEDRCCPGRPEHVIAVRRIQARSFDFCYTQEQG